jgi:sulfatase modifying factor 1
MCAMHRGKQNGLGQLIGVCVTLGGAALASGACGNTNQNPKATAGEAAATSGGDGNAGSAGGPGTGGTTSEAGSLSSAGKTSGGDAAGGVPNNEAGSANTTAGAGDEGQAGDSGSAGAPNPTVTFPSCAGESGTECNNESCCVAINVPGGTFPLGDDDDYSADPEHPATISSYVLDKYEVTVGRFRRWVDEFWVPLPMGAGGHPKIADYGWEADGYDWDHPSYWPEDADTLKAELACGAFATWTDEPAASEEMPINCITWWEAFAFCAWDGGRLASEAEWEYAAAGGSEDRTYPWGTDPLSITRLSYNAESGGSPGMMSPGDIVAVGSTPLGNARWGHADLAGSVEEWVRDTYSGAYYGTIGNPCNDCVYIVGELVERVAKGGSWSSAQPSITQHLPSHRSIRLETTGIRCARDQ